MEQKDNNKLVRFLLTFFLGWIGSLIINCTSLKPAGNKSRTAEYFFLPLITFGIYGLVASICNFSFDPTAEKNIGYNSIMQISLILYVHKVESTNGGSFFLV